MRRRFFVEGFSADSAVMEGEAAHHLGRVLRAQKGQTYELSDGHRVRLGKVEMVSRDRIQFSLSEEIPSNQPAVALNLLLAVVKFDAFEWALEKATELGVSSIVPLAAERSEKALLVAAKKRAERWKKILLESSQQCRRLRVPVLRDIGKPERVFSEQKENLRLVLSERVGAPSLRTVLRGRTERAASLAIGPEGGWTDRELEDAGQSQFLEASLGKLILRTETAVIAALASINYALGE